MKLFAAILVAFVLAFSVSTVQAGQSAVLTFQNITTPSATDLATGEQFAITYEGHGGNVVIHVTAVTVVDGVIMPTGYADAIRVRDGAVVFTASGDCFGTGCYLRVHAVRSGNVVEELSPWLALVAPR